MKSAQSNLRAVDWMETTFDRLVNEEKPIGLGAVMLVIHFVVLNNATTPFDSRILGFTLLLGITPSNKEHIDQEEV